MKTYQEWMDEYSESHKHPTNQFIHKICVPLIMFTVIGFLWSIPNLAFFESIPYLNWATIFTIFCLLFYASLNIKLAFGMLIQSTIMFFACIKLDSMKILFPISLVIFIISWFFQFYGHKLEGKKPSFLKDLVFLLIGPLWVTRSLYQKMGLKA